MKRIVLLIAFTLCAATAFAAVIPHIGYVYPAGSLPGKTLTVTIGGQFLKDFAGLNISGQDVPAKMTFYQREFERQEANRVRRTRETLDQKIEEETDLTIRDQMKRQLEVVMEDVSMMQISRKKARKDPAMARKVQFNPQIAETIKLKIELPDALEPGAHELRVITTNGLSNPVVFQIGTLKEVFETEKNDTVADTAGSAETLPLMLNGQILPGEVDYFRFKAEQGQTLVCQVAARALIPYLADAVPGWFQAVLTLYDDTGKELAYVDDFQIDPDPVLIYEVPKDGEYIVGIRDSIYRGRQDFVYRISVGELPFIDHIFPLGGSKNSEVNVQLFGVNLPDNPLVLKTGFESPKVRDVQIKRFGTRSNSRLFLVDNESERVEVEPNNLPSQAEPVPVGTVVNGQISAPGDFDCFSFSGRKGQEISIEVVARRLGSPLDAQLVLLDPGEHVLAVSDDEEDRSAGLETHHADAGLTCTLPENGAYAIRLSDLQNKGGSAYAYRLSLRKPKPDFKLRMVPSSLCIPQEGSALVTVHVLRQGGFAGPVELELKKGPRGVFLEKTEIPAGCDTASLMITANKTAKQGIGPLTVQGKARPVAMTICRQAVPAEDMMQAFLYRHLVPSKALMVMVTEAQPATVKLELPQDGIVRARAGSQIQLLFTVDRHDGYKGGVRLALSEPPEWVSLKSKGIGKDRFGVIRLDVNENADTGMRSTLILNGSVRIQKDKNAPDYNPIAKWLNFINYDFTIDAISVEIID